MKAEEIISGIRNNHEFKTIVSQFDFPILPKVQMPFLVLLAILITSFSITIMNLFTKFNSMANDLAPGDLPFGRIQLAIEQRISLVPSIWFLYTINALALFFLSKMPYKRLLIQGYVLLVFLIMILYSYAPLIHFVGALGTQK